MYFMIKDDFLDNYMASWEKVSNIMKKNLIVSLYAIKKFLNTEKRFNAKGSFLCFYIPVILFDPGYRKDGNYYPKVFLHKFIDNFLWGSIFESFGEKYIWGFESSSYKKELFRLRARSFLGFPFPEI